MSSGAFRLQENVYDKNLMAAWKKHIKIVFYEDAPDATVSVDQADGLATPAVLGLRINGKADAGTRDMETQLLLAHLPMLSRPGAEDAFVLGMGSGITAGALLAYPVEHIDVAENCEPVIRAARFSKIGTVICWITRASMSGTKTRARCSSSARNSTM